VLCEPEVACGPDQPPEAVQEVAFVELQVSVDPLPEVTELGFAETETVGAGADGGIPLELACL
jgi:hypothetical protein